MGSGYGRLLVRKVIQMGKDRELNIPTQGGVALSQVA
jgi:hypothetical protein